MVFIVEWPEKSPSFRRNRKVWMEFAETIDRRLRNSGKQFYWLMTTNIMYLDQRDVIMFGEYPGKRLGQKVFVQRSDMVAAWWCEEWEIFILAQAAWTDTFMETFFENIWKPVLKNLGFEKVLHFTLTMIPKFFTFDKRVVLVHLPKSN